MYSNLEDLENNLVVELKLEPNLFTANSELLQN